jgi:hypothetical protein
LLEEKKFQFTRLVYKFKRILPRTYESRENYTRGTVSFLLHIFAVFLMKKQINISDDVMILQELRLINSQPSYIMSIKSVGFTCIAINKQQCVLNIYCIYSYTVHYRP